MNVSILRDKVLKIDLISVYIQKFLRKINIGCNPVTHQVFYIYWLSDIKQQLQPNRLK